MINQGTLGNSELDLVWFVGLVEWRDSPGPSGVIFVASDTPQPLLHRILVVNGYIDASFDTDPDDSKSQTRYVFTLNGGAVSWCSSKQSVVAGSTCEAEYMAARRQHKKQSG